jgi:hypothetical protein
LTTERKDALRSGQISLSSQEAWVLRDDSNVVLEEVQQLYKVSDRLDSRAGRHPLAAEALITISGSVRNITTLLEILIAAKTAPVFG